MIRFIRVLAFAVSFLIISETSRASILIYDVNLSGPNESPPNASPGIGFAVITLDTIANTMHVQMSFSGLLGTTTASHIHSATAVPGAGTAGVATTTPSFAGFPTGVTSGTYDNILDMTLASSYNPAFVTANGGTTASAEAALFAGIAAGDAYLNIHTTVVPAGEIRGFLLPAPTPEPASLILLATGGLGIVAYRWRRASRTGTC